MVELYEQINLSLAAVTDWEEDTAYMRWCGIFHNELSTSTWDDLITYFQGISDWLGVAQTKRMAELSGYSSSTIDDAVKDFLTNYPMFTGYALPKNDGTWFSISSPYVLHGYRWARELSWQEAKWDATSGYNGLKHCFDIAQAANKVFHRCNPDAGTYETIYNGRGYEATHIANSFWVFYNDEGIAGAKTDYITCWT